MNKDMMTAGCTLFFHKIFDRAGSREIGLKLLASSVLPDLCKGTTVASFQEDGNVHDTMEVLTRCKICGPRTGKQLRSTYSGSPSCPTAPDDESSPMARDSSGRVAGRKRRPDAATQGDLGGREGVLPAASSAAMRGPTAAKWLLNWSARSGGISLAAPPPPWRAEERSLGFRARNCVCRSAYQCTEIPASIPRT